MVWQIPVYAFGILSEGVFVVGTILQSVIGINVVTQEW